MLWWVKDHFFFWDTVQFAGKHGLYYFQHYCEVVLLPDDFDSGHIPIFGFYLASIWKIFGISLPISHWAMLPFILMIVFFTVQIANVFENRLLFTSLLILLLICDPTLLAQMTLVSPDVFLMAFFTMTLYGFIAQKSYFRWIGLMGLGLISIRGLMVVGAFFIFEFVNYDKRKLVQWRLWIPYFAVGLTVLTYALYHFLTRGWLGFHSDSPWYESFALVTLWDIPKHFITFWWRLLDFGRVGLWISVALVIILKKMDIFSYFKKQDEKMKMLYTLALILVLVFLFNFILFKGVNAHRYLLPLIYVLTLIFFKFITEHGAAFAKKLLLFSLFMLLLGHFWIYPSRISQGWDASLAHLPYYELRNEMLDYLGHENIAIENVGCQFPNLAERQYIDLRIGDTSHFSNAKIPSDEYILYSNIYNDFIDNELEEIKNQYHPIKELSKGGIFLTLYKKNLQ